MQLIMFSVRAPGRCGRALVIVHTLGQAPLANAFTFFAVAVYISALEKAIEVTPQG